MLPSLRPNDMMQRSAGALTLVVAALALGGCGSEVPGDTSSAPAGTTSSSSGSSSASSDSSGKDESSGTPGTIGMGARCPTSLPQRGLPSAVAKQQSTASGLGSRLVGDKAPGQVLLCRYEANGKGTGFRWSADKELPSTAGQQQLVDDLRSVPVREDAIGCDIAPEPTPFVLVLSMPDDAVQVVRADADPTCAYATGVSTNGAADFDPIGNDLLTTWETGRWAGLTG